MSSDRNIIIAYMNRKHEIIKKVRCKYPNPAAERAQGYLANQHVSNPKKGYAVYVEVYEEGTTLIHATLKYQMGTGKILTEYRENPRDHEFRYAVAPLLEEV